MDFIAFIEFIAFLKSEPMNLFLFDRILFFYNVEKNL